MTTKKIVNIGGVPIEVIPEEDFTGDETYVSMRCKDCEDMVGGSKKGICVKCKEEVWISPSGQGLVEKKKLMVVCTHCAVLMAREDENGSMYS